MPDWRSVNQQRAFPVPAVNKCAGIGLMSPLAPPRAPVGGEQWRSVGDVRVDVPRTNAAVDLWSGERFAPPPPPFPCVCSRTKLRVWIGVRAGVKFTLHSLTTLKYLDMQNTSQERPQHSRKKKQFTSLLVIYLSVKKLSETCVRMCFICVCVCVTPSVSLSST